MNIAEEEAAIKMYRSMLDSVGHDGTILYETIEDILKDEQQHKEELDACKSNFNAVFLVPSLDRESKQARACFDVDSDRDMLADHASPRVRPAGEPFT